MTGINYHPLSPEPFPPRNQCLLSVIKVNSTSWPQKSQLLKICLQTGQTKPRLLPAGWCSTEGSRPGGTCAYESPVTQSSSPMAVAVWVVSPCIPAPLGLRDGLHSASLLTMMQGFMWLLSQQPCSQPTAVSRYISSSELCLPVFPWQQLLLDSCNWLAFYISQAWIDMVQIGKHYLLLEYTWTTFKSGSKNTPATLDPSLCLSHFSYECFYWVHYKSLLAHFLSKLNFLCILSINCELLWSLQ